MNWSKKHIAKGTRDPVIDAFVWYLFFSIFCISAYLQIYIFSIFCISAYLHICINAYIFPISCTLHIFQYWHI